MNMEKESEKVAYVKGYEDGLVRAKEATQASEVLAATKLQRDNLVRELLNLKLGIAESKLQLANQLISDLRSYVKAFVSHSYDCRGALGCSCGLSLKLREFEKLAQRIAEDKLGA